MKISLRAFGIAKEILEGKSMELEIEENSSIEDLRSVLINRYPAFQSLQSLRLAVNEEYAEESLILSANDEVVIIPPVAGG